MKAIINKLTVLTLLSLFILTSCSEDEEPFVATASDVTATIDEHSSNGTSLGTVATNITGNLIYSFTSQSVPNALSIHSTTGQISIADTSKFDFETNPIIEAIVNVTNSTDNATAIVSITLNNVDDIYSFLTTSKQAYTNAITGDWIIVTEEEYNTLANNLNEVSRIGATEDTYNNTSYTGTSSSAYTFGNSSEEVHIPSDSYLFAFKYFGTSTADNTNSKIKISTSELLNGYSDFGSVLPSHNLNGENVYFILKSNNTPTPNISYLAFFKEENTSMRAVNNVAAPFYYASGDTNDGLIMYNTFSIAMQGLSTTQKQWD